MNNQDQSRVEIFLSELKEDLTELEICAGLTNGDISKPEWLAISEDVDHIKIWDNENTNQGPNWGFISINC